MAIFPSYAANYQRVNTGWWFQPLWKIWKSVGISIPSIWKNRIHVPNHQPEQYSRKILKPPARNRLPVIAQQALLFVMGSDQGSQMQQTCWKHRCQIMICLSLIFCSQTQVPLVTGHFRNGLIGCTYYIYKAHCSGLNFREYPRKIWPETWYSTSIFGSWNFNWICIVSIGFRSRNWNRWKRNTF